MTVSWKPTNVVLAVLILVAVALLFRGPRDRITAESWKQIRLGMTENEVAGILGRTGMTTGEVESHMEAHRKIPVPDGIGFVEPEGPLQVEEKNAKHWIGERGYIHIYFDERGHVIRKGYWGWRLISP